MQRSRRRPCGRSLPPWVSSPYGRVRTPWLSPRTPSYYEKGTPINSVSAGHVVCE